MNQSIVVVVLVSVLVSPVTADILDLEMEVANDFVHDTCNKTEELKDLCNSVIGSDPRDDLKSNLTSLLTIFINQTLRVVVDDHSYLYNQTLNGELDNRTLEVFKSCMNLYQMSKDSLQALLDVELLKNKNADLNMDLAQVDNFLDLCEVDFEGFTREPLTWKSRYDYVSSLLILSLRMTNLIKCNQIHYC